MLYQLPLDAIRIGGINTRVIDEDDPAFRQLVESIAKDGQLEPVLVGREGDGYRLIAGERRVRAVRAAGLTTVLARITTAPREEWSGLMLIENLMRKDLTVWEEAAGYKALLSMGLTQEEVGRRIHKGKTHVSLVLKIMRNPTIVAALEDGTVTSESMAKELAALVGDDGREIVPGGVEKAMEFIVKRSPTVHQLRAWIRTFTSGLQTNDPARRPRSNSRRGTFLKTEQMRLDAVLERVSEMSPMEIQILAKIYEEYAETLRRVSGGNWARISDEETTG
nr:ParB/RepB/Spo0J family partition protein [Sulfobacillus harzensis]